MKLNPMKNSTQKISEYITELKRPNPPTAEAIKRAQFVDKTYVWKQK